jgi:hypothetical protein
MCSLSCSESQGRQDARTDQCPSITTTHWPQPYAHNHVTRRFRLSRRQRIGRRRRMRRRIRIRRAAAQSGWEGDTAIEAAFETPGPTLSRKRKLRRDPDGGPKRPPSQALTTITLLLPEPVITASVPKVLHRGVRHAPCLPGYWRQACGWPTEVVGVPTPTAHSNGITVASPRASLC